MALILPIIWHAFKLIAGKIEMIAEKNRNDRGKKRFRSRNILIAEKQENDRGEIEKRSQLNKKLIAEIIIRCDNGKIRIDRWKKVIDYCENVN